MFAFYNLSYGYNSVSSPAPVPGSIIPFWVPSITLFPCMFQSGAGHHCVWDAEVRSWTSLFSGSHQT